VKRAWQLALGLGWLGASVHAVVQLPPILVESVGPAVHWRYARTPEFEILAECDDATTREAALGYHRLFELLAQILPPRLQPRHDVPRALLLCDQKLLTQSSQDAVKLLAAQGHFTGGGVDATMGEVQSIKFMEDFSLFDQERLVALIGTPKHFAAPDSTLRVPSGKPTAADVLRPKDTVSWTSLTPSYVSSLLTENSPALPGWFVSGFMRLYRHAIFEEQAIRLTPMDWPERSGSAHEELHSFGENGVARVVTGPGSATGPADLIPLGRLFRVPLEPGIDVQLWLAESELFIRWAVSNDRSAELAQFVDQSRLNPAGEDLFRTCFQSSFAETEKLLYQSIWRAKNRTALIGPIEIGQLPGFQIRAASPHEIALIKGDFERLEAISVRMEQPKWAGEYFSIARRTLRRRYERGDRDPQLVAELGLCELDSADPEAARPLLEAAVAAHVIRPRAYAALARLRYGEAVSQSASRLSKSQVLFILKPIAQGRGQSPTLPDATQLIDEVFAHSALDPASRNLASLFGP